MKKNFKKILIFPLISLFLIQMIYSFVESNVVTAATDNDDVVVTLVVGSGIAITHPADVTMSPNMGMSSNSSIGSSTWTVISNNVNGYSLAVKASASPALVSAGGSFADYTETSNGVPESWSVESGNKEFGFSAFGTHVNTTTWGTGSSCGSGGSPSGTLKYVGFETTDQIIAQNGNATAGTDTTVCYAAAQNGVYAPSGTYTATITATATEL